jgi:hypothetical protein
MAQCDKRKQISQTKSINYLHQNQRQNIFVNVTSRSFVANARVFRVLDGDGFAKDRT